MSGFITRFITGDLVGILIASSLLTWPACVALLALYKRAVRRSMRRSGGAAAERPAAAPAAVAPPARATSSAGDADLLLEQMLTRPWHAAAVYTAAAVGFGATIALVWAWYSDPESPFLPVRLMMLTANFAWPAVLTVGIVAGAVRRQRVMIVLAYAAIYSALIVIGVSRSSTTSAAQLIGLWALNNLAPTIVVLFCLTRRIRAVGPLVLLFLIVGLSGADLLLAFSGSQAQILMALVKVGDAVGLGGVATFFAVAFAGFLGFGVIAAALLFVISRRYERKQSSDESLTIHAIWWLFVFAYAGSLVFENQLAPLSGILAMVVFVVITRIGFARAVRHAGTGHKLLLLRSFSIGSRSERFFDAFQKHWRRVGSIEMIAGFDLAARTIEPHEFLDFITGKVSRRFIDGRPALEQRLREMDTRPDRDGRFRVNEFFCYDDTWRDVLLALVHDADAVLMDLRGFTRQNAGCVFEIGELFRVLPLERIVFLVDRQTETAFLEETFATALARTQLRSAAGTPNVLPCPALDAATMRSVLAAVARAVHPAALTAAG